MFTRFLHASSNRLGGDHGVWVMLGTVVSAKVLGEWEGSMSVSRIEGNCCSHMLCAHSDLPDQCTWYHVVSVTTAPHFHTLSDSKQHRCTTFQFIGQRSKVGPAGFTAGLGRAAFSGGSREVFLALRSEASSTLLSESPSWLQPSPVPGLSPWSDLLTLLPPSAPSNGLWWSWAHRDPRWFPILKLAD